MTQEKLKSRMQYNPETGEFTWLNGKRAGFLVAVTVNAGYKAFHLDSKNYLVHRMAFLYMTGSIPKEVDHKNRLRGDNRWENLRASSRSLNCGNTKIKINNTTGFRGVHWHKRDKKFWACLQGSDSNGNKTSKNLGFFDKIEDAIMAYDNAASERYGDHYTRQLR